MTGWKPFNFPLYLNQITAHHGIQLQFHHDFFDPNQSDLLANF